MWRWEKLSSENEHDKMPQKVNAVSCYQSAPVNTHLELENTFFPIKWHLTKGLGNIDSEAKAWQPMFNNQNSLK